MLPIVALKKVCSPFSNNITNVSHVIDANHHLSLMIQKHLNLLLTTELTIECVLNREQGVSERWHGLDYAGWFRQ